MANRTNTRTRSNAQATMDAIVANSPELAAVTEEEPTALEGLEQAPAEEQAAAEGMPPELAGMKWEAPSMNRKPRTSPMAPIAEALKAKPGEWLMIGERSTSVAYNIRSGQGSWGPKGAFEAVTRDSSKDGKRASIYVRYVGATQAAAMADGAEASPQNASA